MYNKVVAAVLGLNGLLLIAIGFGIIATAQTQLAQLGLEASQADGVARTIYVLGSADAALSIFSFAAAVLVFQGSPFGKILAYLVGADLILTGVGFFILTDGLFGLYFIALRGLVIALLAWRLETGTTAV